MHGARSNCVGDMKYGWSTLIHSLQSVALLDVPSHGYYINGTQTSARTRKQPRGAQEGGCIIFWVSDKRAIVEERIMFSKRMNVRKLVGHVPIKNKDAPHLVLTDAQPGNW